MKSGNEIEGEAVSETTSMVNVDIGYGIVSLEKADISKIKRDTKAKRGTASKELLRNKFNSGTLVPKDAQELDSLFRVVSADRAKALEVRESRAAGAEKIKETEVELAGLQKRLAECDSDLLTAEYENNDFITLARERGYLSNKINAAKFIISQTRQEANLPDPSFQNYLTGYSRLNDYVHGKWKPLLKARRKGQEAEYFAWIREEFALMKRDFRSDSIESEARGSHIIVKVLLNGRVSARLLVDTGATYTTLYSGMAAKLKLSPSEMGRDIALLTIDDSAIQAKEVRLKSIAVGKFVVKDSMVAITLSSGSPEFDGVLGMSFLNQFAVRIDGANNKLILESLK
jgi:clan AA aspartic protease (TIGR02281 family)